MIFINSRMIFTNTVRPATPDHRIIPHSAAAMQRHCGRWFPAVPLTRLAEGKEP
jgi:hypothetical protein